VLSQASKTRQVILHLPEPHPTQAELINAFELRTGVRFIAGACGTKFGKTYGCSIRLVKEAWEHRGSLNWWVAPSYAQSKMAYELVKRMLPVGTYVEYKADLRLTLVEPDGTEHSRIEFKSGDNPDTLRGYAVNFFVIDEAARVPYESFVSVMTTVTQTKGRGIVISTPKGRGWFFEVYQWGQKFDDDGTPRFDNSRLNRDPHPEWIAIRMPTWTNPHVEIDSVLDAKKNLPDDVFKQEFGAEFLDDTAGVFRNVEGCARGQMFEDYHPGHVYVIGVDLARIRDYTVIVVMDKTRKHIVYLERFNQIDWEVQYHKIIAIARRYRAKVCIDSTGIGDPIVQTLANAGLDVEPYKIGGSSAKQQLIDKLRVNIENGSVSYPKNRYTMPMLRELKAFEYTFTEGGTIRFSAPSGQHDDCVIAFALCNWIADTPDWKYRAWNQRGV
jgi:hypothetical protein